MSIQDMYERATVPRIRYVRDSKGILTSIEAIRESAVKHSMPEVLDRYLGGTFKSETRYYEGRYMKAPTVLTCVIHHADELIRVLVNTGVLQHQDALKIPLLLSAAKRLTYLTERLTQRYQWLEEDFEESELVIPPSEWRKMIGDVSREVMEFESEAETEPAHSIPREVKPVSSKPPLPPIRASRPSLAHAPPRKPFSSSSS